MRLIEIPARRCDLGPTYMLSGLDFPKNGSKPLDAAEYVRRKSDTFAKEVDKPCMAQADLGLYG